MNAKLTKKLRKVLRIRTAETNYMRHSKRRYIVVPRDTAQGVYRSYKRARITAQVLGDINV